jgi:hypothetical protein
MIGPGILFAPFTGILVLMDGDAGSAGTCDVSCADATIGNNKNSAPASQAGVGTLRMLNTKLQE